MAPRQGSDPAVRQTPMPLSGDGRELLGLVVDQRYRLNTVLGRGGMGLVFGATHLQLRREVAVKILHPSLAASSDVRSRFEREALAVGKIDHPNCVATFDVGRLADGSLYLAMELLEGCPLADVLAREGQLAPERALRILRHILRGLSGVHHAGLVHRDIKPDNIFLVRQGDDMDFAKILDFGIAKPMVGEIVEDGVRLTQAGMAFGTPIYMSPEQALGNKLDGRADLYAAAVIGYEMLAGELPFYSDDRLEVMSMHVAKPVPAMRTRMELSQGHAVPKAVERLIANGLTKKPEDRYASAEDFIAAIDDALGLLQRDVASPHSRTVVDSPSLPADAGPVDQTASQTLDELLLQLPRAAPVRAPLPIPRPAENLPQPMEMPREKPRRVLHIATFAGAITLGIAAAVLTAPENHPPGANLPAAALTPQPSVAVHPEDPEPTPKIPDAAEPTTPSQEQLALGHESAAQGKTNAALAAYAKALSLSPASSSDSILLTNLAAMARSTDPEVVADAFDMWLGRTEDPTAVTAVLEAAVSESIERRRAARPFIDRYKLADRVDWVRSYGLDLAQEPTCKTRRKAVAQLRALKNAEAIPLLKRAIAKRQRRRNSCLLQDTRAAIRFLKRRAPARK